TFSNPDQKATEIFDCEAVSDAPYLLNATKRNLFEHNRFIKTRSSDRNHRYNAIQHGAQDTVVRHNLFAHCEGGAVNYQQYSDEALYVHGNRLYNNTFYDNACNAIIGQSGPTSEFYDNRAVNNLLYMNTACDGTSQQTDIEDPASVILTNNLLATSPPGFVDVAALDLRLAAGSAAIDAGTFLTRATNDGNGTLLAVDDASYFYDGYGIPGESGDVIQFAGSTHPVRIISIDYAANELTLAEPRTWQAGQGVHLAFDGSAPDMGAYEHSGAARPAAPASVTVTPGPN
ncbi:MAG: right-handed parallel beta-helix repeat-containing protein, partial [Pseudomonadales bacterium]|nr:right-handed parallel beta-helix repeat-containing protein [Pseudomonadales bacterium]